MNKGRASGCRDLFSSFYEQFGASIVRRWLKERRNLHQAKQGNCRKKFTRSLPLKRMMEVTMLQRQRHPQEPWLIFSCTRVARSNLIELSLLVLQISTPQKVYDMRSSTNIMNPIPETRWDTLDKAGFVELAGFDHSFFGISSAEAFHVSPNIRLSMEIAFEALENANIPISKINLVHHDHDCVNK